MIVRHFITLTQPWATLMAYGSKIVETRSWWTRFRGPLAIHAAKGFPHNCRMLCFEEPFSSELVKHSAAYIDPAALPIGQILAVCNLDDCRSTTYLAPLLSEMERAFGDYSEGRYGFQTSGLRRLKEPLPLRGSLGIRPLPVPITGDMLS